MNKYVQFLVAAASIVIVSAGGWMAYSEYSSRKAAAIHQQRVDAAESAATAAKCKTILDAWDAGNEKPAELRYGAMAADAIKSCRVLTRIDDLRNSKPSE